MVTLKEAAISYKSEKKDITSIARIPVDIEVKEGVFTNDKNMPVKYSYIEVDGWKYSVKGDVLEKIQQTVKVRPQTTAIKVEKTPKGEFYVIPLD